MADSKNIDDGGHAYPVCFEGGENSGETPYFREGMSLRDWFAGKFLAGAAASPTSDVPLDADPSDQSDVDRALREHWDCAARAAYIAADAMIAARKGGA